MIEFKPWGKTPRLFRDVVITEKIDGTNAAVVIQDTEDGFLGPDAFALVASPDGRTYGVGAQSRNRLITPRNDNYGFAGWVNSNAEALVDLLGPGHHFGEWWGSGIQRGYGLPKGEKRFSLFNVARYRDVDLSSVPGLGVVPVLHEGQFSTAITSIVLGNLRALGSVAAPGFDRPEGVVVFHTAAQQVFKALIENDDQPKGSAA